MGITIFFLFWLLSVTSFQQMVSSSWFHQENRKGEWGFCRRRGWVPLTKWNNIDQNRRRREKTKRRKLFSLNPTPLLKCNIRDGSVAQLAAMLAGKSFRSFIKIREQSMIGQADRKKFPAHPVSFYLFTFILPPPPLYFIFFCFVSACNV